MTAGRRVTAAAPNPGATELLDEFVARCSFPGVGTPVAVAFSGGPDSTALLALARHAGCVVTAHHVDHGTRPTAADEAERAGAIAAAFDVDFVRHEVSVAAGPNYEARARDARWAVLPPEALTGHTLDDQAETVFLRLLRGAGSTGLGGIEPGPRHPLLAIRRTETHRLCAALGVEPVHDASNELPDAWRNRVRHELLPLADDIAGRDVAAIVARTADLLRDDDAFLDELAAALDPTDARAIAAAPPVLARRALRRWLAVAGYPPDAAAIDRVLDVAAGRAIACELAGGRRVERSRQRLRLAPIPDAADRVERRTSTAEPLED